MTMKNPNNHGEIIREMCLRRSASTRRSRDGAWRHALGAYLRAE